MKPRKGIILAGGSGTRLAPITTAVSKQLLPVYDKPMIYYPLSTLMSCGISEILVITTPRDKESFKSLLGDGSRWNISISYAVQEKPEGIAQAFLIGESFIDHHPTALVLGDNLFHGEQLQAIFQKASKRKKGATVFAYKVQDPNRYGVVTYNSYYRVIDIEEKPEHPKSNYAVTGLYFYDSSAVDKAKRLIPSKRGEYEITDLNKQYLKEKQLSVELLGSGSAWLDTGTPESLHDAASYIRTLQRRQGVKIGCPYTTSLSLGWLLP